MNPHKETTMTTVTVYNSKDKEQIKFIKVSSKLALRVLNRISGRKGWWAKVDVEGECFTLHYIDGQWK